MPLVRVTLVDGVFSEQEKHDMAAELTDVMVKYEGSEAFREIVWVIIEEMHTDGWHMGGKPFRGPASLMDHFERVSAAYEAVPGRPTTRPDLAAAAPVAAPIA